MVLDFIVDILLLIGIMSLFNLTRYVLKVRKIIKMHKDNPNIQGISIVNGEVKVIEKVPSEQPVQKQEPKVVDYLCGEEIDKKDAYRVFADGQEYYFCSWECREAFIKQRQEEGR